MSMVIGELGHWPDCWWEILKTSAVVLWCREAVSLITRCVPPVWTKTKRHVTSLKNAAWSPLLLRKTPQAAKSAMVGRKLHNETSNTKERQAGTISLFWKSHYVPCDPAWLILYNVTRSCKRPFSNNRPGLERDICAKSAGEDQFKFIRTTYYSICGISFRGSTDLKAKQLYSKHFILRHNSVKKRRGHNQEGREKTPNWPACPSLSTALK